MANAKDRCEYMPPVTIENATIIKRNFAGREVPPYNGAGQRNFLLIIPQEQVEPMLKAGWILKQFKPNPDGDPGDYFIQVKINVDTGRPPQVTTITSASRTDHSADTFQLVDNLQLDSVDLIINPNCMIHPDGHKTVTAYLHKIFMKVHEDALDLKWGSDADIQAAVGQPDYEATANTPF